MQKIAGSSPVCKFFERVKNSLYAYVQVRTSMYKFKLCEQRWLPTKLAEWIGENLQEALGFPDKADKRERPGTGWTPDELNHILQEHVVDGALTTFGCVEWESELCRGVMRARCYPFKMPKRRFHGFNPQVYIHFKTSTCQYILDLLQYVLVHTSTYEYILVFNFCAVQDTILVVPPYPYCIEDDTNDVPVEECWYARTQLFFTCHLRPTGGRPPKNPSYRIGPDDLLFNLVFFSTFEELNLPIQGPMEDAGVLKLYDPSPIPCLYVAPVTNVLGRVPLIPLFLAGNSTEEWVCLPHGQRRHRGCSWQAWQQCV